MSNKKLIPEFQAKLENKEITIREAYLLANLSEETQKEILEMHLKTNIDIKSLLKNFVNIF
ncbi:MAG: hypothetical protein N2486_10460 [Caloramator sp.]|nr:hypothetical protein [Caloramator sp.]